MSHDLPAKVVASEVINIQLLDRQARSLELGVTTYNDPGKGERAYLDNLVANVEVLPYAYGQDNYELTIMLSGRVALRKVCSEEIAIGAIISDDLLFNAISYAVAKSYHHQVE